MTVRLKKNADAAKARVVSTYYLPTYPAHMGGIAFREILLASLATTIPSLERLLDTKPELAWVKHANSRDAAHAGDSLQRFLARERSFYDHAAKCFMLFAVKSKEAEVIRQAIGFGHRGDDPRVWGTSVHPIVRAAFGFALHQTVCEWPDQLQRPSYSVTMIKEEWFTARRKPVFDVEAMTMQVKAALDDIGFEGLLFIEVQGMRSQTADLHFHVHGVIAPKRKGALSETKSRVRLERLFPKVNGAKGVVMRRCEAPADVEHFLMYSAKSPHSIKRLYKAKDSVERGYKGGVRRAYNGVQTGRGFKIRDGQGGYSARFAFDIMVVRSMISLPKLIIAHGKKPQRLKQTILERTDSILSEAGIERERYPRKELETVWRRVNHRNPPPKRSERGGMRSRGTIFLKSVAKKVRTLDI